MAIIKLILILTMVGIGIGLAYMIYAEETRVPNFVDNPPTPSPGTHTPGGGEPVSTPADVPAIIGWTVGGLAIVTLVGVAIYYTAKQGASAKFSGLANFA